MNRGFTLIELLVVITIIVVLLALLTPALDRAIYQAELAVCSARLKMIAMTATTYAAVEKRQYPYRQVFDLHSSQPSRIATKWGTGNGSDDRPFLRDLFSINTTLNDPLVEAVDLDGSDPGINIFGSYSLWYRMQYPGNRGMNKLGDRFSWNSDTFNVIASDIDVIRTSPLTYASHPSADGSTQNFALQDQQYGGAGAVTSVGSGQTSSFWGATRLERGPVDLNFAKTDGSVERHLAVPYDAGQPGLPEAGPLVGVPEEKNGANEAGAWHHLPRN